MAKGKLAKETQAAIKEIKNPAAQAAAQAAYDKATKGGSPISQKELDRIQQAAAAASPTGGGPAVQRLGQITHPQAPGGGGGGGGQTGPRTEVRRTNNSDGSVTIYYSDGNSETIGGSRNLPDPYAAARDAELRSAYAIVEDAFVKYGLEALVPAIRRFRVQGLSEEEAQLELEKTPEFKARFAGNEGRIAKGLSAYKPGEYIQAEDTYAELLRSNNLVGLANRATFSKLIGGAVSPAEAQDRINLVFNQIDNAPSDVKNELGRYFSQFGVGDPNVQRLEIAEAILSGEDPAMKLETGIRKAQLRAGATAARFFTAEDRLESIEKLITESGVSNAYVAGQQGFRTLAQIEPQTEIFQQRYQLGAVAGEELEKEAFLGLESQKRKRLKEQEKATFAGSAGTTQASLAQQVSGQV